MVMDNMNKKGRVALCGAISTYNDEDKYRPASKSYV